MLKEKYSLQGEQLNTETGTQRGCGILIRKDVKKTPNNSQLDKALSNLM